ncbi:MAG: PorV/PorQ family protein [Calditrichaeota bacterium]|nr:PorV/PorQ family protein [Calditrichota bacterium]HQU72944.1 PorV/PorQ family protein [Calditrichia bacterium]
MNQGITLQRLVILILFLGGILTQGTLFAQNTTSINRAGTTAAQFLKIGVGGRAIGMGNAYTAIAEDITAVFWNPAGIARIPGNGEAGFNHANWLADIDFDFAAVSFNSPGLGSVSASIISLRVPDDVVRTFENPEGTGQVWDAASIAAGITYARNLTDRFAIGFTGKFVQERIFNIRANGFAVDFGVLFDTPMEGLTLAASISNFGTKMHLNGRDLFVDINPSSEDGGATNIPGEYRTEYFEMPLNMKFGLAWHAIENDDLQLLLTTEANQPNDNAEYINSGVEFGFKNTVFLRGGYKTLGLEDSEQGFTFGAGIRYDVVGTNLAFDFGYQDYGRLENVQFVSLGIRY